MDAEELERISTFVRCHGFEVTSLQSGESKTAPGNLPGAVLLADGLYVVGLFDVALRLGEICVVEVLDIFHVINSRVLCS